VIVHYPLVSVDFTEKELAKIREIKESDERCHRNVLSSMTTGKYGRDEPLARMARDLWGGYEDAVDR